jgi:cytochrome c
MKIEMIKRMMTIFFAVALITSCAESQHSETSSEKNAAPAVEDISANPDYKKGLALVAQNDCLTCHAVKDKLTGPAYAEIAAKYVGAADTTITRLAQTIINGGSGHWGVIPMTAHPNVSEEDAVQMVKYILLLNK